MEFVACRFRKCMPLWDVVKGCLEDPFRLKITITAAMFAQELDVK
jgi:hypothetical protein